MNPPLTSSSTFFDFFRVLFHLPISQPSKKYQCDDRHRHSPTKQVIGLTEISGATIAFGVWRQKILQNPIYCGKGSRVLHWEMIPFDPQSMPFPILKLRIGGFLSDIKDVMTHGRAREGVSLLGLSSRLTTELASGNVVRRMY